MKVSEQIQLFLSEADVSALSRKSYEFAVKKFFLWTHATRRRPENLSKADIIQYKTWLQKQKYTTATVKNYFTVVRIFYHWAAINNIHDDITQGIRPPKFSKKYKKLPLGEAEIKLLFENCDKNTIQGKRDIVIIYLLVLNGLRRNELLNINIADINSRNGSPGINILAKGYSTKENWIPITEPTIQAIKNLLQIRSCENSDPLITATQGNVITNRRLHPDTLSKLIKQKLEKIGLTGELYSLHSLRHSTANILLSNGAKMEEIQSFLRHHSANTTALYVRLQMDKIREENNAGKLISKILIKPKE